MKRKILAGMIVLLCVMAIAAPMTAGSNSGIPYKNFREGDILYHHSNPPEGVKPIRHTGVIVSKEIEGKIGMLDHSAIIVKVDGKWAVRESHPEYKAHNGYPSFNGGVHTTPIEEFYSRYNYEGIKHLQVNVDDETAKKSAEWAKNHAGKWQTNLFRFIKPDWHDDKYYCSEFVYMSYKEGAKTDLAPKPFKLWISPEDISLSKKTYEILSDGSEVQSEVKDMPGGIDFTSIQLNYISMYSNSNTQTFGYVTKAKKAEKSDKIIDIEDATELSLVSFLVSLTLPESEFWVNLNPWEPDRIIEKDLEETDIGRIMLEADLQMKKDFCKYKNPCESEIGKEYSRLLDEKGEDLIKECMNNHPDEIKNSRNVLFPVTTRHWIVPDNVEAYETDNEIFIVNATVDIYSEPVYEHSTYEIVNQNAFFVSMACKDDLSEAAKEYGRYAKELEEEMILPLVVQEVNHGKNYSDLRCVYNSLALAQWYKNEYRYLPSVFTDCIDSKDLTGLESKSDWSAENIWKDYVKSFEEGEYQCWMNETKKETYREDDRIVTETITRGYSCGGVDFMDIEITNIGDMPSNLRDLTSEAVYSIFAKEGNDYYFGDGLYVFYEGGLERARFEISKLIISPAKVKVGKPVTVKFDVENVGDTEGTKTVNIEINGEIVGYKEVTLAPGEIVTLGYTQIQPEEGEYSVAVGKQTGDYTVVTPGFEAIFAIAGLLAVAYLFRRRKRK